jgi:beta-lactam-binding protein with PASTA domain/tRNA A-37 threonylcarbamoyl transferase component Bud32
LNGSVLTGRYRLEARLGAGGMAEVFRGHDMVLDRPVAIKVLSERFASDPSFVDRFRREARAAARLNDRNVVSVFDSGADDGTNFIVMEYIEGRTLADFLAGGGKLPPDKAAELVEHVCDGLAAAHAQGVVHRDIKPANIMVTREGVVKVMDFGIARITTSADTIAQTAQVLGTASYLSPEQAQGRPVDARSDIYSLGIVLYELLAGSAPFNGESPVAVAMKHVHETPPPPSSVNPDVPPALDAVVMRALSKNPANRYQTATAFKDDLERARTGKEVEATPLMAGADPTQLIRRDKTQMLPVEPPSAGRRIAAGILITLLVLAAIAGGLYLLYNAVTGGSSSTVTAVVVPNVVGQNIATAKPELQGKGFVVKEVPQPSPKPQGQVLAQSPAAGQTVTRGSAITLTVAKPYPTVTVPDLTGLTESSATSVLDALGLKLNVQSRAPSNTVPVGHIISQDPPPQSTAHKKDTVNVVISSGPNTVTVPDVTCLPFGSAKAKLTQAGFVVVNGGTAPANPTCPNPNRVANQDPAGGATAKYGSTVTLFTNAEATPSPSST